MFGGWLNLNDSNQYFSCIPRSNLDYKNGSGFSKIKKNSQEFLNLDNNKLKIEIKPGHCILFFQDLIHEILSSKSKIDMYRIFHSFRITKSSENIFNYENIFKNQAVPYLPSGQIPPMYAKLHWTNHIEKLQEFSTFINEKCLEKNTLVIIELLNDKGIIF